MRKLLSPAFSLLTVTGGHFLNRRLDLGLLFFVLLLSLAAGASYAIPMLLWLSGPDDPALEGGALVLVAYGLMGVAASLWFASAAVSYLKAGEAAGRPPLGRAGLFGSVLAVLLSVLTLLWIGTVGMGYLQFAALNHQVSGDHDEPDTEQKVSFRLLPKFFHQNVRFGGTWVPMETLESMPGGTAFLSGRIRFEEEPAVGVTLRMVFSGRYVSDQVVTDDHGMFTLAVPPGKWTLNRIEIDGWRGRPPAGSFTVLGGPNPTLASAMYHEGPPFRSDGVELVATPAPQPLPDLDLVIRKDLQLQWPDGEGQEASRGKSRISWEAREGANLYQVQLHRMEVDGTTTSYFPVAWINTAESGVPLSAFPTARDESGQANQYAVRVFAFDEGGELLSVSNRFHHDHSLVLRGESVMKTEELRTIPDFAGLPADDLNEQMEMRYRDKKRLAAARTLLSEGLTEAARTLVDRVESPTLAQERLTVSAMFLAADGRCDEARMLLEKVDEQRGSACLPEFYSERCGEKSDSRPSPGHRD